MIRPFTCVCVLLAAVAGMFLYQTKHRTLMLDQQIADVLKQALVAQTRSATLRADYTRLIEPDRLGRLAQRYLKLQAISPVQWVQLAGLDAHLPPVEDFSVHAATPADAGRASAAAAAGMGDAGTTDDDAELSAVANIASADAAPAPGDLLAAPAGEPAAALARGPARLADAAPRHRGPTASPAVPDMRLAELHAQPVPMAAPHATGFGTITGGGALAGGMTTAALHPAGLRPHAAAYAEGQPARPQITAAAYAEGMAPRYRHEAAHEPPLGPPAAAGISGHSALGQSSGEAMAPPVPVAN